MDQQVSKSVIVKEFGGYESLLVDDFGLLSLSENIQVKVEYAGLNFADLYTRKGLMPDKKLPFVLGMECTGVITKIGDNVKNSNFKVGQRVICYDFNGGMYREIVNVSPNNIFLLPDTIDTKLGATIFVNYLTAYFSLFNLGNLREYESVLILSCTGGVGSAAVQLSKTVAGVKIYGTGSISKETAAKENGVDKFYCTETIFEDAKDQKFDLILSNESGPKFLLLQNFLKPLGRIILIGANNMLQSASETENYDKISLLSLIINNRSIAGLHIGLLLYADPEKVKNTLDTIFKLIEQKKLNPIIHSIWKMSEIVEATKLLEERKNVGKVLLSINA